MSWSNVFVQLFRFVTWSVESQAGSKIDSTHVGRKVARKIAKEIAEDVPQNYLKNSKSPGQEVNTDLGSELFAFDSQALTQLAAGSSVFIASVLAITDVIPLIPNATSVTVLFLRVVGDWIIAAVIWFLGFLAITQLLRFVSRGVWVSDKGIKLSRFDRLVPWKSISAVSVEPNFFFTRLFSLKETARRLTILFHFEIKNKLLSQLLFPNYVPSFFFSKETFDRLVKTVFERSGALPTTALPESLDNSYAVLATTSDTRNIIDSDTAIASRNVEDWRRVKRTYQWLDKQKILVGTIVLFSLLIFLGRKAMVYYCFNSAGKAAAQGHFELARDYYQWSVKLEPTFAAGWNGLGQAEFRLAEQDQSDFSTAERDWQRAIFLKRDFVEPRLNIVRVYFYQRKFKAAEELLEHAAKLAPEDGLVLLEKAELDLYSGNYKLAQKKARLLLSEGISGTQNPQYIFKARCLMAQAKLLAGDLAGAESELARYSSDPQTFHQGEDITFFLMTRARILFAAKQYAEADEHIHKALSRQPFNQEVLLQAALISLALKKYDQTAFLMKRAQSIKNMSALGAYTLPLEIIEGGLAEGRGNHSEALVHYRKAEASAIGAHNAYDRQFLLDLQSRLAALAASGNLSEDEARVAQSLSEQLLKAQ